MEENETPGWTQLKLPGQPPSPRCGHTITSGGHYVMISVNTLLFCISFFLCLYFLINYYWAFCLIWLFTLGILDVTILKTICIMISVEIVKFSNKLYLCAHAQIEFSCNPLMDWWVKLCNQETIQLFLFGHCCSKLYMCTSTECLIRSTLMLPLQTIKKGQKRK